VRFTEHLFGRVQTDAEWRAEHAACLADGEDFDRERYAAPDGTWYLLVCACGSKHLIDDPPTETKH
jgi:hypothetical protein